MKEKVIPGIQRLVEVEAMIRGQKPQTQEVQPKGLVGRTYGIETPKPDPTPGSYAKVPY